MKYAWMADILKRTAVRLSIPVNSLKVKILLCTKYRCFYPQEITDLYKQDVLDYLMETFGLEATITSSDLNSDFLTMLTTPVLASTGSSLSFFAGLGNNSEYVYLPSVIKNNLRRMLTSVLFWHPEQVYTTIPADTYRLMHEDVVDYADVKSVCKQLREPCF